MDLYERGFIYESTYSGWYCPTEESFVGENLVNVQTKVTRENGYAVEWCEEKNWMFRLTDFIEPLRKWISESNG